MHLIRVCGRWSIDHVAVGDDELMVDPRFGGAETHPARGFIRHQPGLTHLFHMQAPRRPALESVVLGRPNRALPTILRWLTRGRVPTTDCVAVATAMLRSAGVEVPRRIVTPRQLNRWLLESDAELIQIEP